MTRSLCISGLWGSMLLIMLCLAGCGGKSRQGALVLFVFDETSSFVEDGYWAESIRLARVTVDQLAPGDAVGIIGIDHHGFDTDDIRLPVTVLSRSTIRAVTDRMAVKASLSSLQPRKSSSGFRVPNGNTRGTPTGTDTLGALDHAAQLAAYFPQRRVRVVLFSDMRNEPITGPSGYSGVRRLFIGDCRAKAYFVDESGGSEWKTRVTRWTTTLNKHGLACRSTDFHGPAMSSPSALSKELQHWIR